jgi:hypothetical protein
MNFSGEMRRFARALSSVFSINPGTDYRAAFPCRTPEEMMDRAWERTMSDWYGVFEGYEQRDEHH